MKRVPAHVPTLCGGPRRRGGWRRKAGGEARGPPAVVLGLLWQIIKIGLFNQISLEQCPGLTTLLEGGEQRASLMKMSPEAILLR